MTEPVRPLEALIAEKIEEWRAKAATINSWHATMGTGWHVCADELAALLQAAAPPAPTAERHLQRLINDLHRLFTSTPAEIAREFGESRCMTDHDRINYALEWMQHFVTPVPPERVSEGKEP